VNGRKDFGIKYSTSKYFRFIGYSDSDCGSSIDYWKSTYVYTLKSYDVMGIKEATHSTSFFSRSTVCPN
jgi:hypothetical protein